MTVHENSHVVLRGKRGCHSGLSGQLSVPFSKSVGHVRPSPHSLSGSDVYALLVLTIHKGTASGLTTQSQPNELVLKQRSQESLKTQKKPKLWYFLFVYLFYFLFLTLFSELNLVFTFHFSLWPFVRKRINNL